MQNSTQPKKLNVEVLLVTDSSVYKDHQRFSGSNDTHVIFMHMKIYFSHVMMGVNQRYQNSMSDDHILRLTIKLANFLFLTVVFFSFVFEIKFTHYLILFST